MSIYVAIGLCVLLGFVILDVIASRRRKEIVPDNEFPDYCNGCRFISYNDFYNVYLCSKLRNEKNEGYCLPLTQDNKLIRLEECIKKYGKR